MSIIYRRISRLTTVAGKRLPAAVTTVRQSSSKPRKHYAEQRQRQQQIQPLLFQTNRIFAVRNFCADSSGKPEDGPEEDKPPTLLMNFLPRGMPNLFYSLKNLYIINFVLRGQIDRNFVWKEFIEGAKQALVTVSELLADNRLDELDGLVDPMALQEIRQNYEKLSLAQRRELKVEPSDIVLAFAHHIDVETLQESFTGSRKHIVNFFIVFDVIRGLEETLRARAQSQGGQTNPRELFREFADRKTICNYEFRREYIEGKGPASDWIVSKLLHIKEKDLIPMMRLLK